MPPSIEQQIVAIRTLAQRGEIERANQAIKQLAWAHRDHPLVVGAQRDLALHIGDFAQGVVHARRAAELSPSAPGEQALLGLALQKAGRHEEAMAALRRTLELDAGNLPARRTLLLLLHMSGMTTDILRYVEEGVALIPGVADLRLMLADAWSRLGEADRAAEVVGRALLDFPSDRRVAEMHCFLINNSMSVDRERVLRAHQNFGRLVAQTVGARPEPITRSPEPERRLRVGVVSSDFRQHSVWHFITPWLEHVDRERFEIVCLNTGRRSDKYTAHLVGLGHRFVDLQPGDFERCIRQVRDLELDVLVELGGLTDGTVVDLLYLRGAPVQVSYIGYPNTTGVPNIDWRIVDSITDPAEQPYEADRYATEKLYRLDPCFLCYRPPLKGDLPDQKRAAHPPGSPVVFGSFNAAWKVTDEVLRTWAQILRQAPEAELWIKSAQITHEPERARLARRCAQAGMDPARVKALPAEATNASHLSLYDRIDVALDTFPYQGTTTTCESLLMGVPVVTVSGLTHASRVGASLLNAAGLGGLACGSVEEYIRTAARLAADVPALEEYHRALRERVLASTLCDGPTYARRLEGALRTMWKAYCAGSYPVR